MTVKKVKRVVLFLICIAVLVCAYFIIKININFQKPEQRIYSMGDTFDCENMLQCSVTEVGFYSKEEEDRLFHDIKVNEYEIIGCYVKISVVNRGENDKHLELGDYVLTSNGWKQCVNYPAFLVVNNQCKSTLAPGDGETYILPYTIPSSVFTNKQWEDVKNRSYSMIFSLYPIKREVVIQL